jgi:hypothetical protein
MANYKSLDPSGMFPAAIPAGIKERIETQGKQLEKEIKESRKPMASKDFEQWIDSEERLFSTLSGRLEAAFAAGQQSRQAEIKTLQGLCERAIQELEEICSDAGFTSNQTKQLFNDYSAYLEDDGKKTSTKDMEGKK